MLDVQATHVPPISMVDAQSFCWLVVSNDIQTNLEGLIRTKQCFACIVRSTLNGSRASGPLTIDKAAHVAFITYYRWLM
jgi:hypothetical protein